MNTVVLTTGPILENSSLCDSLKATIFLIVSTMLERPNVHLRYDGHPRTFPLIRAAASMQKSYNRITVYQSSEFPKITDIGEMNSLNTTTWIALNQCIYIGADTFVVICGVLSKYGGPSLLAKYKQFCLANPNGRVLIYPSFGGAAQELAQEIGSHRNVLVVDTKEIDLIVNPIKMRS